VASAADGHPEISAEWTRFTRGGPSGGEPASGHRAYTIERSVAFVIGAAQTSITSRESRGWRFSARTT
jgi:hypothetical protein